MTTATADLRRSYTLPKDAWVSQCIDLVLYKKEILLSWTADPHQRLLTKDSEARDHPRLAPPIMQRASEFSKLLYPIAKGAVYLHEGRWTTWPPNHARDYSTRDSKQRDVWLAHGIMPGDVVFHEAVDPHSGYCMDDCDDSHNMQFLFNIFLPPDHPRNLYYGRPLPADYCHVPFDEGDIVVQKEGGGFIGNTEKGPDAISLETFVVSA